MSELKQSIAQLLIDNFKGATSKKASDMAIAIMAFVNADREREIESAFCGTPGTGECSCRKFADNPLKCDNRRTQPEATKPAHADQLIGLQVSMDVSTGDDDAEHRIFGKVIATMPSEDGITILAEEESRNFAPAQDLSAAMADQDQVPYLIVYDDVDQESEPVIGATRAAYRFGQISASWNAHLYVKIASNSRNCKYPNAALASPADALVEGDRVDADHKLIAEIISKELGCVWGDASKTARLILKAKDMK